MRKITEINRIKKVYNLTIEEFMQGKWLNNLSPSKFLEISYKNNYLTISDANIKKLDEEVENE